MKMKLGRLIGNGATAEVYELDNDTVVKLYIEGSSNDIVRWEFHKALCAYENQLPVPKVYEMVEYEGRFGFIMEHVKGETLKNEIDTYVMRAIKENIPLNAFAEQIFDYIKLTAHCLNDLHKMKAEHIVTMDTMDQRMLRDVYENHFLTENEKNIVKGIIESLPKGDSVCHGDPNPNNIIVNGDRFIFIDWVNSGIGNPLYDIAEYVLLTTPSNGQLPEDTHPKIVEFYNEYKDSIIPVFLAEYEKISKSNISDYKNWFVPLLVSKLNSNRSMEEKMIILDDIRRRL